MTKAKKKPSMPALPQGRWSSGDLGANVAFEVPPAVRTGAAGGYVKEGGGDKAVSVYVDPLRKGLDAKRAKKVSDLEPLPGARASGSYKICDVKDDANGRRYRRAMHPLEVMHEKGLLTKRQCDAGLAFSSAWEATCRGPSSDLSRPRVDSSPKPDVSVTIQLERKARYTTLAKALPREGVKVCHHVCCEARFLRDGFSVNGQQVIRHLEMLRIALDCIADARNGLS